MKKVAISILTLACLGLAAGPANAACKRMARGYNGCNPCATSCNPCYRPCVRTCYRPCVRTCCYKVRTCCYRSVPSCCGGCGPTYWRWWW